MNSDSISQRDLDVLRSLLGRIAEIAALPEQREKADLWRRLNRLERTRPLILLLNGTWHETGDEIKLECEGKFARDKEWEFRAALYRWDNMRDDAVYDGFVRAGTVFRNRAEWKISVDATRPDHVFGACHYNPVLKGDEDPADYLALPDIEVDQAATDRHVRTMSEIAKDIMPVRRIGVHGAWFAEVDRLITWRGIDNVFTDMVDRPDWVHAWLNRLTECHIATYEMHEKLGTLTLNNGQWGAVGVGPGGLGITDQLPQPDYDGRHARIADLWGHAATQIFAEVSPEMHDEFALRYESRFLSRFGLAGYGCCEPLHRKVDLIRRRIPNLRRLSMSPWADVAMGAAALKNEVIFSYKPNPAILGMETFDLDRARRELRGVFDITRGCVVEVLMKDLHTVHGEPKRMGQWVRMALELAEEYA